MGASFSKGKGHQSGGVIVVIISPGRAYVFVHIPKTGGTALSLALEARAKKDDILIGDTPKAKKRRHRLDGVQTKGRLWKHSTLADIDGLVSVDALDRLFVFTLVRNPWDRMVSYYHWLRAQSFAHPAVASAKSLGFTDFLNEPHVLASLRASSAASYVTRADNVLQCAAFIRIEHFEQDAAPLFSHLGFTLTLPRVNASVRARDYRLYFTATTAQRIADACQDDIDRFGYAFG